MSWSRAKPRGGYKPSQLTIVLGVALILFFVLSLTLRRFVDLGNLFTHPMRAQAHK